MNTIFVKAEFHFVSTPLRLCSLFSLALPLPFFLTRSYTNTVYYFPFFSYRPIFVVLKMRLFFSSGSGLYYYYYYCLSDWCSLSNLHAAASSHRIIHINSHYDCIWSILLCSGWSVCPLPALRTTSQHLKEEQNHSTLPFCVQMKFVLSFFSDLNYYLFFDGFLFCMDQLSLGVFDASRRAWSCLHSVLHAQQSRAYTHRHTLFTRVHGPMQPMTLVWWSEVNFSPFFTVHTSLSLVCERVCAHLSIYLVIVVVAIGGGGMTEFILQFYFFPLLDDCPRSKVKKHE